MELQKIKQRFGIIGNSEGLNRAIDTAVQVAPTDLSVLITGESGVGKEVFPKIIHQNSIRKHESYIAVNCGAIPEGTIDSELFGHEKGSFTGATESRKGYFEVADKGTIFLDEVGELPLATQVRLLRVLETGEFIRVGSSKVQKTDVRVVAATNVQLTDAIRKGKFREDLFYRLNTVPISIPPLRERQADIHLLFRKFAYDFAEKYRMPSIKLDDSAVNLLNAYKWPGNIRQLKNITEQISIIEEKRLISADKLRSYLPTTAHNDLPALYKPIDEKTFSSEREILYQILFDMKRDMNDLKKLVNELMESSGRTDLAFQEEKTRVIQDFRDNSLLVPAKRTERENVDYEPELNIDQDIQEAEAEEVRDEILSMADMEIELIKKALEKHQGKRKLAAQELGISERTLYRKIKDYDLNL